MTAGLWFAAGAMALARFAYPRLLERRHEARFVRGSNGIVVGAEPIDLPRPGAPAALLLHGGGDAPQSMRGLAEYLHARGYAVRAPLLENHGRALEETRRFSADRWHAQVRGELEALRAKHPRVALVGQSVGGALALDLAAEHSGVSAMVLLAPWIAMSEPILSVARLSRVWGPLFPYLPSLGGHSIHDTAARARALTHGLVTPAGLRALRAVAISAQQALPRVMTPTLVMQSREDARISSADAEAAFTKLAAPEKRFEWLSGAGHVISVDFGKERVFSLTADWLDSHQGE